MLVCRPTLGVFEIEVNAFMPNNFSERYKELVPFLLVALTVGKINQPEHRVHYRVAAAVHAIRDAAQLNRNRLLALVTINATPHGTGVQCKIFGCLVARLTCKVETDGGISTLFFEPKVAMGAVLSIRHDPAIIFHTE